MQITTSTFARINFQYAIGDVTILVERHDAQTNRAAGRPDRNLEVFKRAGVILAITAWEAYIEDTLVAQFGERLEKATAPAEIESVFNLVAHDWLNSKPKPPDIAIWTGDRWKATILEKFKRDISTLNTPNTKNVKKMYQRYLDLDITKQWKWRKASSDEVGQQLDALIGLRGRLVHKGKDLFESRAQVRRSDLLSAKQLVERLVECTDRALKISPVEIDLCSADAAQPALHPKAKLPPDE
jgi:hypothetical protein